MRVKLLNKPTLEFADSAIGQCYNKGPYTDPVKMENRIHKVACVQKHSSTIEFIEYIFEIEACTKVLLEFTRHRLANYACQSSRYTLDKGDFVFEPTGDSEVDQELSEWKKRVESMISQGKKNDITSMMLPQAFMYKFQVKINARSLQNFFLLRLDKHAHYKIKEVAEEMLNLIPQDHKFLFKDQ